jgi:hypothetical protein
MENAAINVAYAVLCNDKVICLSAGGLEEAELIMKKIQDKERLFRTLELKMSNEDFDRQFNYRIERIPIVVHYKIDSYWKKYSENAIRIALKSFGYKDLGWMNGWKHIYVDKEGNQVSSNTPGCMFTYQKEDYPEYCNCHEQKHKRTGFSYSSRGSSNLTICDTCKIYWWVDSSD